MDFDPAIRSVVRVGPESRWFPLLSFLDDWGRPIWEGEGLPLSPIERAERRLGFRLPAALREWYLFAGRRSSEEMTGGESLRAPEDLQINEGALIFYDEPQGVVSWGILEGNLSMDDPPVVIEGDWANVMPGPGWFEQNHSVSEFVFQMEIISTMSDAMFDAHGSCDVVCADKVRQLFKPLGFPDWYWPSYPTRYFGGVALLIKLQGNGGVSIAAQNDAALNDAILLLPEVEWTYINGEYVRQDKRFT